MFYGLCKDSKRVNFAAVRAKFPQPTHLPPDVTMDTRCSTVSPSRLATRLEINQTRYRETIGEFRNFKIGAKFNSKANSSEYFSCGMPKKFGEFIYQNYLRNCSSKFTTSPSVHIYSSDIFSITAAKIFSFLFY